MCAVSGVTGKADHIADAPGHSSVVVGGAGVALRRPHAGEAIVAMRFVHLGTALVAASLLGSPALADDVVCDGAMLLGFGRDLLQIGPDAIREVAEDLKLTPGESAREPTSTQALMQKRKSLFDRFRRQAGGA